ncbi:uncharacterized protein APUU_20450A [Aspergillus puulaauensis]|uniref:Myb-like DNA-binding domain-containing protein n=1 Tax=Aspergillus puulaauensis TaxID=1220207 RepID=A0A7R8AK15_9EURO|nr:uncharacterized protein APUU_20450A [Aspergillus puulaauensis]BCS20018.1 hypothetical protein APUU_20450A [Aspergillus puulaauensis]
MPAASLPDAGLMFLYLCLVNSDMTKINYEAVGAAAGLKVPAARMRYSRLKKQIESGLVDGKLNLGAGAGEQEDDDEDMAEPATPSPSKKRKVAPKAGSARKKVKAKEKDSQLDNAEENLEDGGAGFVKDEEMSDA